MSFVGNTQPTIYPPTEHSLLHHLTVVFVLTQGSFDDPSYLIAPPQPPGPRNERGEYDHKPSLSTLECAHFIRDYSETKSFWRRLGKDIFSETDDMIKRYNNTLDDLMQQFWDQTHRDVAIFVQFACEILDLSGMVYAGSSFYDPTQASGFTPQQPTVNVWDAQFIGPGGEYFPRQNTSYQQPYRFEGAGTSQYSFAQDQVQQQNSQPRPLMHTARRSARGSAQPSGYYRQGGAQSQQYSQAPSVPSNPPSTQPPPPQPSQQPTSQILAAQRTTQLIAGQFPLIRQSQFPPTPEFSQSQFSQPDHPHVPTQSLAHPQSQPQVHTPPNPSQQSQHYSVPSDPYYLQTDMYYVMNMQGSQSVPSLISLDGIGICASVWVLYFALFWVERHT
ncbi:hypothetical protein BDR04DRAFT_1123658 [Suillus decipiens]|nr:hypothetical protein BDR04DRAFT_1123658 [Suillus decipiens]